MLTAPDFKEKQIIFALLSHGERLSFKNDNIIISDDNGIKHQSSCYRLFALFIVGHISITSGLLYRAKKFGFSIVMMSHGLIPYGMWFAKAEGNVLLRQKQYEYDSLDIAQYLIHEKINQQIMGLKSRRQKTAEYKKDIIRLVEYQSRLPNKNLELNDVLGIEGAASRLYFKNMFGDIGWKGRKPRAKRDIPNVLLDIGYTQLFYMIEALLNLYGFDIYKGFYHQTFYQRKSLVCDMVEPFRPWIDLRIRKAFILKQIHEDDFIETNGQFRLFGKAAKPYVSFMLKNLLMQKESMFYFVQSFYRAFMQSKPIMDFPKIELE
ncbi:MAG: type V CRISPR-associated endonuclease Cas1 [Candidatus Thioglobus sp.]|nr:type V CRISPR-associated endonuclease Cas1 [Candidatus Thioglobus sp.]